MVTALQYISIDYQTDSQLILQALYIMRMYSYHAFVQVMGRLLTLVS